MVKLRGVSLVDARGASSPPLALELGWWGARVVAPGGECGSATPSLSGLGEGG